MIEAHGIVLGRTEEAAKQKALELAIELRYLAADGKLDDTELVLTLTELLEKFGEAECSGAGITH